MARKSIEHEIHKFNQIADTVPHQARRIRDVEHMADNVERAEAKIVSDFNRRVHKRR
jgi:hypothetical protein